MKKIFLLLVAASVMFVSCKKDEVVEPTKTSEAPTAKIMGKVYAELDLTNTTAETAPANTTVIATATYSGNTYRYETTISGGSYEFTIPAVNGGVAVTIQASDFRSDVLIAASTYNKDVKFSAAPATITIVPGITKINDINY